VKIVDKARPQLRRLKHRGRRKTGQGPTKQRQIRNLRARVAELEAEVIENRQLARRIAELTDVVEQLLLPGDLADSQLLEERLQQIRTRH